MHQVLQERIKHTSRCRTVYREPSFLAAGVRSGGEGADIISLFLESYYSKFHGT
jgi:hypothetical protein